MASEETTPKDKFKKLKLPSPVMEGIKSEHVGSVQKDGPQSIHLFSAAIVKRLSGILDKATLVRTS